MPPVSYRFRIHILYSLSDIFLPSRSSSHMRVRSRSKSDFSAWTRSSDDSREMSRSSHARIVHALSASALVNFLLCLARHSVTLFSSMGWLGPRPTFHRDSNFCSFLKSAPNAVCVLLSDLCPGGSLISLGLALEIYPHSPAAISLAATPHCISFWPAGKLSPCRAVGATISPLVISLKISDFSCSFRHCTL